MVDRSNSERLRGFDFGLTDRQTDRFAIVESLLQLKNKEIDATHNISMFNSSVAFLLYGVTCIMIMIITHYVYNLFFILEE